MSSQPSAARLVRKKARNRVLEWIATSFRHFPSRSLCAIRKIRVHISRNRRACDSLPSSAVPL